MLLKSINFYWDDRKHIASRKKFIQKLFRIASVTERKLSIAEDLKFKSKECDDRFIEAIYPNVISKGRTIDMFF